MAVNKELINVGSALIGYLVDPISAAINGAISLINAGMNWLTVHTVLQSGGILIQGFGLSIVISQATIVVLSIAIVASVLIISITTMQESNHSYRTVTA
jgi:hypothetical protein